MADGLITNFHLPQSTLLTTMRNLYRERFGEDLRRKLLGVILRAIPQMRCARIVERGAIIVRNAVDDREFNDRRVDGGEHGCLDLAGRRVHLPQLVPLIGHVGEVGRSPLGPFGSHRGQPLVVSTQHRGGAIDERSKGSEEVATLGLGPNPVIGAGAFGMALEESGLGEYAEMAADPGLGLAEDLADLRDGQFA